MPGPAAAGRSAPALQPSTGVETLARHHDEPVMARQGSVLVATFHPELTDESTVHAYFCRMVREAKGR